MGSLKGMFLIYWLIQLFYSLYFPVLLTEEK